HRFGRKAAALLGDDVVCGVSVERSEEESVLASKRAAYYTAGVTLSVIWFRQPVAIVEPEIGVQALIVSEVKQRAVKLIGARARDEVDRCARIFAELHARIGGLNLDFRDRVRIRYLQRRIPPCSGVFRPI